MLNKLTEAEKIEKMRKALQSIANSGINYSKFGEENSYILIRAIATAKETLSELGV